MLLHRARGLSKWFDEYENDVNYAMAFTVPDLNPTHNYHQQKKQMREYNLEFSLAPGIRDGNVGRSDNRSNTLVQTEIL